jgi:predicted  nucleic acid-binding Zn-ribbon protein
VKQYTPVIAIVGVILVVVLVGMFTASPLQSPEARLFKQIDGQVEKAKRLLWDYNPADIRLAAIIGPPATQPADQPTEKWQQTLQDLERNSFDQSLQQEQQRKDALRDSYARLNGEPPKAPPSTDIREELNQNAKLLAEALKIVQEARAMSDGEVTGANHPTATRLEAILCYQQADLNRRQAAVQIALADQAREQFDESALAWNRLEVEVTSISRELGQEHALVNLDEAAPPASPSAAAPAVVGDKSANPVSQQPGAAKAEPGKGVVGKLFNSVLGSLGKGKTQPKSTTVKAADKAPKAADKAPEPKVADKAPEPEQPAVKTPPLGAQITQLTERKSQVQAAITAAEETVKKLTGQIEDTQKRLAAAQAQASEAEQKMFKLEDAGVKKTDPKVLDKFVKEYNAASAANRAAYRESAMLAEGALKGAKTGATNEDEMLTAPLTGDQGAERGLVALQSDLKAEQGLVESNTALLKEIERQITDLNRRQQTLAKQLTQLKGQQATCAEKAGQAAKAAIAAILEADQLATKGIGLAEGAGQQAARRAKDAAGKRMRDAEDANGANAPESRNQRLTLIAGNKFTTGHAIALEGDMAYAAAMIQAQREESLRRHARLLAVLETLGIKPEASLLPEGVNATEVPPAIVKSQAAGTAADEAHAAAIKAARLALETYNQADEPLKQLWVLHANLGAINYLLANLSTGEEAQQYLTQARLQYQRALKGQEDRPEAQPYKEVLAGIAPQAK